MPKKKKFDPSFTNFYDFCEKEDYYNPNYPQNIQFKHPQNHMIIGRTGTSKTNIVLNIIEKMENFTQIILVCKMSDEPLYKMLIEKTQDLRSLSGGPFLRVFNSTSEIPNIDTEIKKCDNTAMILDDIIAEDKRVLMKNLKPILIKCRKVSISCFILTQSFYQIPKCIRQNCQMFIIRGIGSSRDKNLISGELDIDKETMKKIDKIALKKDMSFVCVDISNPDNDTRYTVNFGHNYLKNVTEF